ncbi:MAG: 2-hydroxychromene-2-carboxylate isomerase [Rhodobacteraceae bacterium]|nr:2-hydroxychromene-2-carboxylate isomerase [Paracoccaceae bacterium]
MPQIDYFFSVLSPFTYLASDGLEQVAARRNTGLNYKPFDIMNIFSRTGGVAPKDRHESRQRYRLQDLVRISRLNGMRINLAPAHWPTDPLPASYAVIAASRSQDGDAGQLVRNLLAACWAGERDIAQPDVIADCLVEAGFSGKIARQGDASAADEFQRNTEEAYERGVFGAPAYLVGSQLFWGQDRLPHLDAWLAGEID